MHRPSAVRVIAAAGALSVLLGAGLADCRVGGSVHRRELSGRPAELQHDGVQRLRDQGDEDPCAPATRRAPGCAAWSPRMSIQARQRGARGGVDRDDQRARRARRSRRCAGRVRRAGATVATRCSSTPMCRHQAPIAIKNVRANQNCPGGSRAAGRGLPGAHLQRQRRDAHRAARDLRRRRRPSGHARRAAPTTSAPTRPQVGVVDGQPPAATIAADTPLASGAWVSGNQPAQLRRPGQRRRARGARGRRRRGRRARSALVLDGEPERGVRQPDAVPERPRADHGRHAAGCPKVRSSCAIQAQDTAGNLGASAPVTARIDNTPPARADVVGRRRRRVAQPEQLHRFVDEPRRRTTARRSSRRMYKLCPAAAGGSCSQGEHDGRRHRQPARSRFLVPASGRCRCGAATPRATQDPQRGLGPRDAAL